MPVALYFLASCLRPVLEGGKQRKNGLILIDLLGFVKNLRILKQYYYVCYSREGRKEGRQHSHLEMADCGNSIINSCTKESGTLVGGSVPWHMFLCR